MAAVPGATCLVNAELPGGASTLRVVADRIAAVGVRPARGDRVIDLRGDRLLPGLINAHDHLQFSNFGRTRYRDVHENVRQWIIDVTGHLGRDPQLDAAEAVPLDARLLAGGVKNLLSGVTTVAHHDEFQPLFAENFPVRVLRAFGWAHSLGLNSEAEVRAAFQRTPAAWAWIIHAGEGTDAPAAAEFTRLEALGCISARTLLVHALAFGREQLARLMVAGAAVVWCPSSNLFLFGRTLDPHALLAAGRLAFGSDSRISGARDLLDELRAARQSYPGCEAQLEALVTRHNARLLRLGDRGTLVRGALADLVVLPAGKSLFELHRADLRLVMIGGVMRYGDASYAAALAPYADCVPVNLDGREKVLDRTLVERLAGCHWREPGLEFANSAWRAA